MSGSVKLLNDNLNTLDQQFYLVMDRYLKALTQYYATDTEDDHLKLEGVEGQLNPIYQKTFILASRIEKEIDDNNAKSLEMDKKLKKLKKKYDAIQKMLRAIKDHNLAAPPLKKEMRKDMLKTYFYAGYYSIAILCGSYFIYKKLKS